MTIVTSDRSRASQSVGPGDSVLCHDKSVRFMKSTERIHAWD